MPSKVPSNEQYFDTVYADDVIGHPRAINWIHRRHVYIGPRLVGSVLDLGCGLGLLSDRTKERYLGVDFSYVAIRYANTHTKNKQAIFCEMDVMAFCAMIDDDEWDTVVLGEVLEHFEPDARSALLAEAKRIAKGRVVISVPENSPDPSHVQIKWNREQVKAMIGPAEIVRTRGHWYAVWEKNGRANHIEDVPESVEARQENCNTCN